MKTKLIFLMLLTSFLSLSQNKPARFVNGVQTPGVVPSTIGTGVGINTTDPQGILDIQSTDLTLLIPRMTTVQKAAITLKEESSLIYDLTLHSFQYWDGTVWTNLGGGGSQNLEQVLTEGNESTTKDAIFRLDADKYLKINRADQRIEFWDESIDEFSSVSSWNKSEFILNDGTISNTITTSGIAVTETGGNSIEVTKDVIGIVDDLGNLVNLTPGILAISNGIDVLEISTTKITLNGVNYPFPTGATSPLATLADITGGATNLGYTASPTNGIVTSDTGTDATILLADGTNSGLLKPAKYTVLENTSGTNTGDNATNTQYSGLASSKQDTLVSGTNIKTIEGNSLLGSGNIDLSKSDVGLLNVDNTSDANKPVSTATQTALNLKSNIASPTFTGTVTTPAIIISSETASRIASFDASKNVKSLDTATYPSLTELAYVKGVTSGIQTQITTNATNIDTKQSKISTMALTSAYALTNTTSLQKAFNVGISGNGAFNATLNKLYRFKALINMTGLPASASTISFGFLGTATITTTYTALGAKASTLAGGNNPNLYVIQTTASSVVASSSGAVTGKLMIDGIIRCTGAGTVIPSISVSVAGASMQAEIDNFCAFEELGSNTLTATSDID
jgi:hypothetical protein